MDTDLAAIEAAHAEAQQRFAAMVRANAYADPQAPETIAYIRAERHVDDLLANAQWEASQRALAEAFRGDHYIRPVVLRSSHTDCDCHYINREGGWTA